MNENICIVCGENELVSEQERIEQVCSKCADAFDDVEAGPEQDFDEMLIARWGAEGGYNE